MIFGKCSVIVTMIAAINASGNNISPMLIYPQVNFKTFMNGGAPSGASPSIRAANASGWSNAVLFFTLFRAFYQAFIYRKTCSPATR